MYSVRRRALSCTAYVVHPHSVPSSDNFDNACGIGPLTPVLIVSTAANPLPHLTPYQPLSSLLLRTEYGVHTFHAFRISVWLDTSQIFLFLFGLYITYTVLSKVCHRQLSRPAAERIQVKEPSSPALLLLLHYFMYLSIDSGKIIHVRNWNWALSCKSPSSTC